MNKDDDRKFVGESRAFPIPASEAVQHAAIPFITYRQWLVGQIATGAVHGDSNDATAKWVVLMADAIIKRMEEK